MPKSMEYRPEIDGLRAIAVLSVILFHGEIALPGGFLGVDVFFVISGYLISSILIKEYDRTGSISITNFYERRIRRILPALTAVCLACFPIAYLVMLPESFSDFLQSMIAAQLFVANIFFWNDTGYFAAAAETKPLLHTWSLAVEEQFYLFFPLLFVLLRRKSSAKGLLLVTLFGLAASLALSIWGFAYMRSAAFYLTPFRVWELFAGVLAALIYDRAQLSFVKMREYLAWVGLALILAPMIIYDSMETYAVPYMVMVIAGAFMLVLFAKESSVGRLLSTAGFVFVGKISYSAYLVHQPLFVFVRHFAPTGLSLWSEIGLAIGSLVLGWLSWKFVEQPFRKKGSSGDKSKPFKYAFAAIFGVVGISLAGSQMDQTQRWSDETLAMSAVVSAGTYGLSPECSVDWMSDKCVNGSKPNVLLWGDSYAMHLAPGLADSDVNFRQIARASCPARAHPKQVEPTGDFYERACTSFNNGAMEFIVDKARADGIDTIILSARDYGMRGGTLRRFPKEAQVDVTQTLSHLGSTIDSLLAQGFKVGIVGPPPPTDFDPAQCVLKSVAFGGSPDKCRFDLLRAADGSNVENIALQKGIPFLNIASLVCSDDVCEPIQNGKLVYRDNGHLTPDGANWVFNSEAGQAFLHSIDAGHDQSR